MTESDIKEIEGRVGFHLPETYCSTVLSYPFSADSFADEFMLPNRPSDVISLNEVGFAMPDIARPFFVGSDGGEESYFVDASKPDSPVFVYDLEAGHHRVLVPSWAAYLEHIRDTHVEGAADERAERARRAHEAMVGILEMTRTKREAALESWTSRPRRRGTGRAPHGQTGAALAG